MNPYTVWFVLFSLIGYLIVTDNSIARAFYLTIQIVRIQYEKIKWWALHNPANPIIKYLIWRRSMKLSKELQRELAEKSK